MASKDKGSDCYFTKNSIYKMCPFSHIKLFWLQNILGKKKSSSNNE